MASYLVALTAEGGIPLFTRTKGDLPQVNSIKLKNTMNVLCTGVITVVMGRTQCERRGK